MAKPKITITVNGIEHELRYSMNAVIDVIKNGGETIGIKRRLSVDEATFYCNEPEFLMFVFAKGLGASKEDAEKLFEEYMDEGEPDAGGSEGRYQQFILMIQEALNLRFNLNLKNARDRAKAEREAEEAKKKEEDKKERQETIQEVARKIVLEEMDRMKRTGSMSITG